MSVSNRDGVFADEPDDDLPRTLRRERAARERAQQPSSGAATELSTDFVTEAAGWHDLSHPSAATVTGFNVPFFRLLMFCFKLVFAAIPALIVLGFVLWVFGHLLITYYPWLVKVQILIRVPP